ncbi:ADP-ribosylation factor-like protein 10 [Caretta caretta]|uniref:ADP-ribosylation factor-like protein 10 n=1 Tax=Caretta caretta TaxID=8467 RepID=UPI003D427A1B
MAPPGAFGHLSLALGAAVAALGSLLFIAWRTYFPGGGRWGARWGPPPAAGQLDFSMRQVLVLGLEGAGKSSVLHYISSEAAKDHTAPTQGFNSVQVYAEGFQIDLLELGGSQNLRFYWNQYLSQAHVLVFVVDSSDGPRLPTARQELHWLLAEDPRLPLVVLANKQDKGDALSTAELHQELALHTLNGQREFFLLPTSATHAALASATSIRRVKSLLVELLSQL